METLYTANCSEGIQCLLCPHCCKLKEGDWGRCRARTNQDNKVVATNYGQVAALALDPIEKKPLFHFYPGKQILSVGTFGCNFNCAFCQNWQLAHETDKGEYLEAGKLAQIAAQAKLQESIGLAYTYSEPLMWYEYVKGCALEVKKIDLQNVLVTNGFINPKPLAELLPLLDAANIDVKSFNTKFYDEIVGGDIKVVLRNVERFKHAGVHLELTFLLVTSLNAYQETKAMVKWIKEDVGKDTPLHISRYFPNYKMDLPPTPIDSLMEAYETAKEELDYVYLGNVSLLNGKDTLCPSCSEKVISRSGYYTEILSLVDGHCASCGYQISVKL